MKVGTIIAIAVATAAAAEAEISVVILPSDCSHFRNLDSFDHNLEYCLVLCAAK